MLRPIFLPTLGIIETMDYQKSTTRIIRTLIGVSLLIYIFTNTKMSYWLPYYTFHTNVFVGLWYVAVGLFPGKQKNTFWIKDGFKGAVTTYITITGLVYNAVLIPYEKSFLGYIPLVSIITHSVVPTMMILDYIVTPTVSKPDWKKLPWWLSYPWLYAAFCLINGAISGFYPYPFINPTMVRSTGMLVFNYIALILVHAGLAAIYLAIARRKAAKQTNSPG